MSEVVRSSVEALETLRVGLGRLAVEVGDVTADAEAALRQTHSQALAVVSRRQAQVNRLSAELDQCRRRPPPPTPNCAPIATALADAERSLADAQQAVRAIEQAMNTHSAARARLMREIQALTSQGRNSITAQLGHLVVYLAGGSALGVGSSTDSAGIAAAIGGTALTQELKTVPDGYRMVPLGLIEDSADVRGPEDFKKPGYSPEDLAWSYTALREVVLPALARGLGADHFAELDARQGFMGTHSYTECFNGFFSAIEAIRLNGLSSGRYSVANGRHRIWVARELGLDAVPVLDPSVNSTSQRTEP